MESEERAPCHRNLGLRHTLCQTLTSIQDDGATLSWACWAHPSINSHCDNIDDVLGDYTYLDSILTVHTEYIRNIPFIRCRSYWIRVRDCFLIHQAPVYMVPFSAKSMKRT